MRSLDASSNGFPSPVGPDSRMVCGPVISNFVFLDVCDIYADDDELRARLVASPRQEVWLESTGEQLQSLSGSLRIVDPVEGAVEHHARLSRDGEGFCVELSLPRAERSRIARLSADGGAKTSMTLMFDVEYQQAYESPGGYCDAYGIQYWDDVRYPVVDVDRVEFD